MSKQSTEFSSLLKRAREGDERALEELARGYESEVRMVAHVRLGPALRPYLDSVDLVQSVHKSLLRGLRRGRFEITTPEQLVALALTMVRRKVARQWRRNKRRERGADARNLAEQIAAVSSHADPAKVAQLGDAVAHVCEQLDAAEQGLIELRLRGYSTAQAARELGRDPDVVRVQLSRLRRRLRAQNVLAEWL